MRNYEDEREVRRTSAPQRRSAAAGETPARGTSRPGVRPSGAPRPGNARPTVPRPSSGRPQRAGLRPVRPVRPAKPRRPKRRGGSFISVLAGLVLAVALAFAGGYLLREYVFDIVRVSGDAMHETLMNGDLALVSKLDRQQPGAGDVVAVRVRGRQGVILRRVIGVPGQTVEFKGGETLVDGSPLIEHYISLANYEQFPAKTLPHGKYYVCGDNRSEISDSRGEEVGLVSEQDIVGRVRWVIWPFNHVRTL